MTSVISGVRIPDSKLAREAAELVRSYENEMLFNHSVRVYAFGALEGVRHGAVELAAAHAAASQRHQRAARGASRTAQGSA